ncbi:plastocyanin/azurin family copper-binding protein [Sporosarcina koreensis]|uniref:plastocyanin/azurin family copper-binding protein n=1 Tax=Sporosarcina koreensis TaxID=334735 RepID=UPI000752EE4A|nr:plastocyanin/azurin family copper-binding protein [Sporosarcina koreensis]
MGNYQSFVLGSLGLLTVVVVILAVILKKTYRTMQGMMIAMFFGMNVGLTAGVLLGVTYQGNLFFSTILSMAIGMIAGILCGLSLGILPVLDGVMSGVMGGMMGAMVGEMIRAEQSIQLIQIFPFLSICTIFIMAILKTPRNARIHNKKWLVKPVLLSSIIAVYIIWGYSFAEKYVKRAKPDSSENHHSVSAKNTEKRNQKTRLVVLETAEMKYSTNEILVDKDKAIKLTLTNLDQVEHDIEIKLPFRSIENASQHDHGKENNVIHLHASPKSTETLIFTPTEAGVYEFYCTVPGHKEFGMAGKLIVS